MIFSLVKLIVWLAGIAVIAYFALPYFGYDINLNYWNERRDACQEKLAQCRKNLLMGGLEGAKEQCDFQCINPKLLIEKK